LITLEIIHRFVCCLDAYYGNVCELDIVYGMPQAYAILDELVIAGEMSESRQDAITKAVKAAEDFEVEEELRRNLLGEH
jgi:AP-1 complex subunit sigma 1/2